MSDVKRKFAVFDIDGTYFRFQLYWQTSLALARAGKLPGGISEQSLELYENWKNRMYENAFEKFDAGSVRKINEILHQIDPADYDKAVIETVIPELDRIYTYPKKLKEELQKKGYFILAISGSRQEEVDLFAKHHGFDDWIGQKWHRSNDGKSFSGEITHTHKDKHIFLEEFVKKHNLTFDDSYAIGDTSGDIDILDMVENPIAFNPNQSLLDHAKKQGWKIVVERKSISYTLEKGEDGSYQLV